MTLEMPATLPLAPIPFMTLRRAAELPVALLRLAATLPFVCAALQVLAPLLASFLAAPLHSIAVIVRRSLCRSLSLQAGGTTLSVATTARTPRPSARRIAVRIAFHTPGGTARPYVCVHVTLGRAR